MKNSKKVNCRITENEVESYLERWRNSEGFSDFNLALDRGLILYACDLVIGAGAIDDVDEDSSQVLAWYDKHCSKKKIEKERNILLNNTEVWVDKYNEHYFIPCPGSGTDYFITQKNLADWGFKFDSRYGPRGGRYKTSLLEAE